MVERRRPEELLAMIRVGPARQEQAHDLEAARARRHAEGRVVVAIPHVDRNSGVEELTDAGQLSGTRGREQLRGIRPATRRREREQGGGHGACQRSALASHPSPGVGCDAAMRSLSGCLAAVALWSSVAAAADPPLESDEQRILYSIGVALSRSLGNYDLTPADLTFVQRGLADGALKRTPEVDLETFGPRIDDYLASRRNAAIENEKDAGRVFCEKVATEEGAVRLDSGVIYFELNPGSGAAPTTEDTVKVHYRGTLRDGTLFDTSREEGGEPATFALTGVVPCFSQGILRMRLGGTSKLVCPPETAYGDTGFPPLIRPGATLVFEVELLEIQGASAAAPPTP
jgi:FKBP-type peptidyl-prolyl cis-trans isomerase